jgi:hypothetical protein
MYRQIPEPQFQSPKIPLRLSARNHGLGDANAGAIEKEPHAQSFGAFGGNEPHLAADVIDIFKGGNLSLIVRSIPFQAGDTLFDGAAKSRADFETILIAAADAHRKLLGDEEKVRLKEFCIGLKFFQAAPILLNRG